MQVRTSAQRWLAAPALFCLLLTGCTGNSASTSPEGSAALLTAAATDGPPAELVLPDNLTPGAPAEIRTDARFSAVNVRDDQGAVLAGTLSEDGSTWKPARTPRTGRTYRVDATVVRNGAERRRTGEFGTQPVADANRLKLTLEPRAGSVVGVAAPVVVRFDQAVQDRAAVERALHVRAESEVVGAWHWVDNQHLRFRPRDFWPTGTDVRVALELDGVAAGDQLYGARDYDLAFSVGDKRVAQVDGKSFTMTMFVDDRQTAQWPTSLGKPEHTTRSGTYVVQEKHRKRTMTSCNANLTCDRFNADYYDIDTEYGVRLTWSGTFVHAAPWSAGSQGRANVSHGCINLSMENARAYFEGARYGDVVVVTGTSRDSSGLVQRGDPGMVDWNQPWDAYVRGSALGSEIRTAPLN